MGVDSCYSGNFPKRGSRTQGGFPDVKLSRWIQLLSSILWASLTLHELVTNDCRFPFQALAHCYTYHNRIDRGGGGG